jgi:hypothetical protein
MYQHLAGLRQMMQSNHYLYTIALYGDSLYFPKFLCVVIGASIPKLVWRPFGERR